MGKKRIIKTTTEESTKEVDVLESAMKKAETSDSVKKVSSQKGKFFINASYNNVMVSAADDRGNILAWASGGNLQFKGPKKATPFAAARATEAVLQKIKKSGISDFDVFVKGVGSGRESAIRMLISQGVNILSIKDTTPVPHGGVKPPKARRV